MIKMRRLLTLTLGVTPLLLLASCSKPAPLLPKPTSKTITSLEQKQCLARCAANQKRCLQQSVQHSQQCTINQNRQAHLKYEAYVTKQLNANKDVKRSFDSFLDLSSCENNPNCRVNYQQCAQSCH